jgi:hypothetical protein
MSMMNEFKAAIAGDLLGRIAPATPMEVGLIASTADLAAWLQRLDHDIRTGVRRYDLAQHQAMTNRVLKGLSLLGTDRIGGSLAERIAQRALGTELAALDQLPAQGQA